MTAPPQAVEHLSAEILHRAAREVDRAKRETEGAFGASSSPCGSLICPLSLREVDIRQITNPEDAVAAAKQFLRGRPGEEGPFSVRAEQDFWIVTTQDQDGMQVQVYVDLYNGDASYFIERWVDVDLI